jgi:hypothetical protein
MRQSLRKTGAITAKTLQLFPGETIAFEPALCSGERWCASLGRKELSPEVICSTQERAPRFAKPRQLESDRVIERVTRENTSMLFH